MASLIADTTAESLGDGRYRADISEDWAVWGPNGGYMAALALSAAMAESRFSRPASFHCHFLSVGSFAPADIQVSFLGGGKRAESLRVDIRQDGQLLLAASVWMVDTGLDGYEHESTRAPDVPRPDALDDFATLAGDEYAQWYPIWRHIEGRPVAWRQPPGDPVWHCWLRFVDTPIDGPAADAIRQLFWLDLPGWNAVTSAHPWPFPYLTPNLDLSVQFHRFRPDETWMLADGSVPLATEGVLGCTSRLWTPDGTLLATATSKHSCRRNPGYAEELEQARREGLLAEDDERR